MKEEELFDYIKCPAYYDMKYNKNIPMEKEINMQYLLNNIAKYFYSNLLNKKICSMDELKRKWDHVCQANKQYIDSKKNIEGLNYIINFAKWSANNNLLLADFDSKYKINIGESSIEGAMSAISILPGKRCELIINKFSNQAPDQYNIDKNIKYTLDCYAFKRLYNYDISIIKIIHHKNNSEFITQRTENDFERLKSTIKGVELGIKHNSYYPRETVFCRSCFYKQYCKYWFL